MPNLPTTERQSRPSEAVLEVVRALARRAAADDHAREVARLTVATAERGAAQ